MCSFRHALPIGLIGLVFGAVPAAALSPTPVPGGARCDEVAALHTRPDSLCRELAAAPRLDPSHPHAVAALGVWARLAEPVEALTERSTGVVLLAPEARQRDGRPLPPAPWICPGAPPVVYVPFPLLAAAYAPANAGRTPLGEDFLGFVLAHELGHRVNDFTVDGCAAAFAGGPDKSVPELEPERRADFRGAFFAAVAGFDARTLAGAGTIARFLENELYVRPSDIATRTRALDDALGWFDALEDLYQAGLVLTLVGERGAAARFLSRLDEQLAHRTIPLPEVTLAHALALLSDATPAAPWLAALDPLPPPLEPLVCRVVHPSRGAFAPDTSEGRTRGVDPALREAARRDIERARRLIERAGDLGAAPLAVASARACAALLAGDLEVAASLADALQKRAPHPTPAVRDALAGNVALARFAGFLAAMPAPLDGDPARQPWLRALARERPRWSAHGALDRYVARLVGQPSTPPNAAAPRCNALASPPFAPLPAVGPLAAPAGACPAGWERFVGRTDAEVAPPDLALCRKPGLALIRASLPSIADPPLRAIDRAVLLLGAPPAHLGALAAWACGCERLVPRGLSELGEDAWLASCPRLGLPLGLLLSDARGRVRRVALVP